VKLSVSNIAWGAELDTEALDLLVRNGVQGLEVAPTRLFPDWEGITPANLRDFRRKVEDRGLLISSLQSILFQKPGLQLFGPPEGRILVRDHLIFCADFAAALGATAMVFGAPRNRDRGVLSPEEAFNSAVTTFQEVAPLCADRGVALVFEANPVAYGCNFATDSTTAAALVRAIDVPSGMQLHLDTACVHLAGENVAEAIASNQQILRHFHVSEPQLGAFEAPVAAHSAAVQALDAISYSGWVALEMRTQPMAPLERLAEAVSFLRGVYGRA
jgi:D-psicose/D-tagatose/L-ribulose 3-epimerase